MLASDVPSPLSRERVAAIAALANLELDDSELDLFARQLAEILAYAEEIQAADTTGVAPTAAVVARHPADRPDVVVPSLDTADALMNAPEATDTVFPRAPGHRMSNVATARETRDAVRAGAASAVEACRSALARLDAAEPELHAFNTVAADRALARAAAIDRDRTAWRDAPLAGVPVAVKDNICTRGVRTTASSRALERFIPPYDATVIQRLEAAGAVVIGKTNCDEFAMGSSTENSAFGPARNPWALDRTPGGSSGGSAAAVAARITPLALGSDTGGSIRQPAAMCGVVGLKPTYGRVSRYGLIAFGSSLDQVGPIATCVADAAMVLRVLAGHDPADATSAPDAVSDYEAALTGDIRGIRIGVPRQMLAEGVDPGVALAFNAALDVLEARGAALIDIELAHARFAIPVYYLVATAEASSNLARYDGVRYGLRAGGHDLRTMYRAAARPASDRK